jgi:4'-phosphopantetheinyl transferase
MPLDAFAALPEFERGRRLKLWHTTLSAEEQRRADSFKTEALRGDYIAAHAGLRLVLGRYLNVLPAVVQIQAGEGIKPSLAKGAIWVEIDQGREDRLDLRFNLSHTRGAVLIGVTAGREIGVDIEWQRPMEDLEAMARSVMSDEELELWKALGHAMRARAFYQVWTRKEAYLKAIGLGLYRSLQDVTVPVSAGCLDRPQRVLDRAEERDWMVMDISVSADHAAAVCWQGADQPKLTVRDLDIVRSDLS